MTMQQEQIEKEKRRRSDSPRAKLTPFLWSLLVALVSVGVTVGIYQQKIADVIENRQEDRADILENQKATASLEKRVQHVEDALDNLREMRDSVHRISEDVQTLTLNLTKESERWKWRR